jgi:acetylornithine deacetylase/succinyl-diaminopimelate desuccinylase-like protein
MKITTKWLTPIILRNSPSVPEDEASRLASAIVAEIEKARVQNLRKIASKGGKTTKARHKRDYFVEIGKLGGRPSQKRRA